MKRFRDWLSDRLGNQEESSAFTRLRADAAKGLKPGIPAAALHSRSTASPSETEKLTKKKKKKKKKKKCVCGGKCDSCKEKLEESKKRQIVRNNKIDDFLNAVGALKDDTRSLEAAKDKRSKEDKDAAIRDKKKSDKCRKQPQVPQK